MHITPHKTGFALENNGIQVIRIYIDSDPIYNDENESTFIIYDVMMISKGFEGAYFTYSNNSSRFFFFFFSILLYILKLACSRFLTTLQLE